MEFNIVFDDSNPNWNMQLEYNLLFIRSIENHLNDRLRIRGHVFLNEVYDALGFPRMFPEGQTHGWAVVKGFDFTPVEIKWEEHDKTHLLLTIDVPGDILELLL